MSDFEIDFEWPVAKYAYQPSPPVDFSWDVDQWVQHQRKQATRFPGMPQRSREEIEKMMPLPGLGHLIRKGTAKKVRPRPEKMRMAVEQLIARKKPLPFHQIVLKIAGAIGALNPYEEREELEQWDELANYLQGIFKGEHEEFLYDDEDDPNSAPLVGEVGIFLDRAKNGKLKLALRPADLRHALILYAARMATTGTTFGTCLHCKGPFLRGGSRQSKKRGDAQFCSSECRWKHHNEMRRKAKSKL